MASTKPKLLLIARNFPPVLGGIEQLMKSTFDVLCADYDIVLLGPRGSSVHAREATRVIELPTAIYFYLPLALLLAPLLGIVGRPTVVISANGLMAPVAWLAAAFSRARHIGFLHGLDLTNDNKIYRALFLPFVRRTGVNVVNSANTRLLALASDIPAASLTVINPCIRQPLPLPVGDAFEATMSGMGPYILYAGRVIPRKGLLEFLQASAGWLKGESLTLVVAGDAPTQNAGASQADYGTNVQRCIGELELTGQVKFLGKLSAQQMASCFRNAAVQIMPLVDKPGDVEGFGMVVVEAASYGVATVAFNCGGVADAIASADCLLAPGDYAAMHAAILHICAQPHSAGELQTWAARFYPPAYAARLKEVL